MLNQTSLYFDRMMKSMGDKSRLIEHIPEDTQHIVDVGGADGSFAKILSNFFPKVTVLDASPESCERSRANGVTAVEAYADEMDQHFGAGEVDVIIASSVIHEIFSYGHGKFQPGRIANVIAFFRAAAQVLPTGGRLLVRDGIRPIETYCSLRMEKDFDKVFKFVAESPFAAPANTDRTIRLATDEYRRTIYGDMASLWEFIMTYTWGDDSWEREIKEYYGVFTKDEMSGLANAEGFSTVHFEAYIQDGYPEHLPHVKFFNSLGEDYGFPLTNAIWVFERL